MADTQTISNVPAADVPQLVKELIAEGATSIELTKEGTRDTWAVTAGK